MKYWLVYSSFDDSGWETFDTLEAARTKADSLGKECYKFTYKIVYGSEV